MKVNICRHAPLPQTSSTRGLHRGTKHALLSALALMVVVGALFPLVETGGGETSARDFQEVQVTEPGTVVDLQPWRHADTVRIQGSRGEEGTARLINLNPNFNAWYLLKLDLPGQRSAQFYHMELANPGAQTLLLDNRYPNGLIVVEGTARHNCALWGADDSPVLRKARESGLAYAPLCDGRVYLRNLTKGHRTEIEAATEFLRDNMPEGEHVVDFVRDGLFRFVYQEKAERPAEFAIAAGKALGAGAVGSPEPALLDPSYANRKVKPAGLGIEIESADNEEMVLGAWYGVKNIPGVFVSVIVANAISSTILESNRDVVGALKGTEGRELVYLVAFDLGLFDLKYSLGTEHPRVDWSGHMLGQMRDPSIPGPDGIGNIEPLVSTGLIRPPDAIRTVAAFAGGFKRTHGAFKYGALAWENHGSHYGFIEDGVILSRLQPGLATIYVVGDQPADLKTWAESDNRLLPNVRYARQNGVPLIDGIDPRTQSSITGSLVNKWGEGNWSGSVDKKLQTVRAGAALQQYGNRRFLINAFFWSATPNAMVRVFQAYRCSYAMLLDMNAPVHTYLALYRRQGSNLSVQHLVRDMRTVDLSVRGQYVPRFLGYSDNRDFFYLVKKEGP